MPAGTRGLLDSVKTSSYHIKSVVFCKQNKKPPTSSVKLIVWRDGGNKRYDFEAEDSKKAGMTSQSITFLQVLTPPFQLRLCQLSKTFRNLIH